MSAQMGTGVIDLLDTLDAAELNALPVGVIQLDATGTILVYNDTEADLARRSAAEVVGRNFFTEVATCTRVQEFQGRFEEGVKRRELDVTFRYRFRFSDERAKDVKITMSYRPDTETVWMLVERP
jgi:photoactive yellow protein